MIPEVTSCAEDAEELAARLRHFAGWFEADWIEHKMLTEAADFVLKCAKRREARMALLQARIKARRVP